MYCITTLSVTSSQYKKCLIAYFYVYSEFCRESDKNILIEQETTSQSVFEVYKYLKNMRPYNSILSVFTAFF